MSEYPLERPSFCFVGDDETPGTNGSSEARTSVVRGIARGLFKDF